MWIQVGIQMQNRFGLKDFILLLVVGFVGLLVIFDMLQSDRAWQKMNMIETKLEGVESMLADSGSSDIDGLRDELAQLKTAIASRPINITVSGVATSGEVTASPADDSEVTTTEDDSNYSSNVRDESWARPGVPIDWQPEWSFTTTPKSVPGYRRGGEFTDIFGAQPVRITPMLSGDVYGTRVIDQCLQSLASIDSKTMETRGVLADAWQFPADGSWLRVHINPKAKFSDGVPLTSEDVRYTFMDFIKNPQIEAERSRATLDMIENVKVIDEHTVEFEFNKAVFTNLTYTMGTPILAKHFYSSFEPTQINQSTGLIFGSGMFKLKGLDPDNQWTPGEPIVLARNERYWGEDSPPLSSMRFVVVTNDLSRLVSYRNGDGDMVTPSSEQYASLSKDDKFVKENKILNWLNMRSGYSFIGWQCGNRNNEEGNLTPFHDPRVRRGMTMILDRETMIRDIWEGVGEISTGPNSPSSPSSNPDVSPWPYDPVKSDQLFVESGWEDKDGDGIREYQLDDGVFEKGEKFQFEFTITKSGSSSERIVSYLRSQCLKNGIVCNPRMVDWSYYSQMLKNRDFDAMIMGWSANSPESDPKQIWHSSSILDQGDNFIQWNNSEADALIDQGRQTMNAAGRMKSWQAFHAVVHEDQPYTFLRVVPWLRFLKNDVGNVVEYPVGLDRSEFFRMQASTPTP